MNVHTQPGKRQAGAKPAAAKSALAAVADAIEVKLLSVQKHFPAKTDLFAGLYEDFHAAAFTPLENGPGADTLPFWLGLPARFDKVAKAYRDVVGLVLEGLAEAKDPDLIAAIGAGLSRTADALVGLIRAADTVVFIVSPASVASPVCTWEVGQVRSYSKRLAPVVIADVDAAAVPAEISRINYIFFTGNAPFDERVDELAHAAELYPHHAELLSELAEAYQSAGQTQAARRFADRAVELDAINHKAGHIDKWLSPGRMKVLESIRQPPSESPENSQSQSFQLKHEEE